MDKKEDRKSLVRNERFSIEPAAIPDNYGGFGADGTVVTCQPQNSTPDVAYVKMRPRDKPNDFLWVAVLSCLMFGCVTGAIAMFVSIASNRRYMEGDLHKARCLGRTSLVISLVGIAITVVTFIVLLSTGVLDEFYKNYRVWELSVNTTASP